MSVARLVVSNSFRVYMINIFRILLLYFISINLITMKNGVESVVIVWDLSGETEGFGW